MRVRLRAGVVCLVLYAAVSAFAQSSASFSLEQPTFNQGGSPAGGTQPSSASFTLGLSAIGETVAAGASSSASFATDSGLVATYAPPGETLGLLFAADGTTLGWSAERSVGTYSLYRGAIADLPGSYGACLTTDLAAPTTTDTDVPPPGTAFFYLVTAENRLGEEGTKGETSAGLERPNATPCP